MNNLQVANNRVFSGSDYTDDKYLILLTMSKRIKICCDFSVLSNVFVINCSQCKSN